MDPTTWFTSDLHFGHENIIKFSSRPYATVEAMNEAIIENWNAKVAPQDHVWMLGDFSFADRDMTQYYLRLLNGQINVVYGNHDKQLRRVISDTPKIVNWHGDYKEIKVRGQNIVLCHYPLLTWNKAHYGAWMLHGHCHGTMKYPFPARILDVGVDVHKMAPVSFETVQAMMAFVKPDFPDHHKEKEE